MSIFSRLACAWAVRSFGRDHVINVPSGLRIVEEAIELCQAVGVPQDKVDLCTDTVYKRPPGDPLQEIGGILLTTNIMCASGTMGVAGGAVEPDDLQKKNSPACSRSRPNISLSVTRKKLTADSTFPTPTKMMARNRTTEETDMRIQIGFFTLLGLLFITLKLAGNHLVVVAGHVATVVRMGRDRLPLYTGAAWTLAILALAVIMETIDTMRGR